MQNISPYTKVPMPLVNIYNSPKCGCNKVFKSVKREIRFKDFEVYLITHPMAFAIVGTLWLALVGFFSIAFAGSVTNFSDNALYSFLEAGVTGYDGTENNAIVTTVVHVMESITVTVYPIMGLYALFMIGLHMVGTVIFLMHPVWWRSVHRLHLARKAKSAGAGKGISGIIPGIKDVIDEEGVMGFIKSIIPDVAEIAFEEALALNGDEDYIPTLGDFFKYNMIKYVGIIAICMLIMDKTLITFMFRGAEVIVSFFKRGAYNYNYVVMIDNFLEQGNDYTPPYDTTKIEEANKKKIFDKIYAICKSDCTEQSQRTTTALQAMGQSIKNYVDTTIAPKVGNEQLGYKNFTVKAEKVLIGGAAAPDSNTQFFIPYSNIGFPESTDMVAVYISAVEDKITDTDYRKTNYNEAWGSGTPPTLFDYSKVDIDLQGGSSATKKIHGYASVRVIYKDGSSNAFKVTIEPNSTTLKLDSINPDNKDVYAISIDSSMVTYEGSNGRIVMGTAIWRNPNIILSGSEDTNTLN